MTPKKQPVKSEKETKAGKSPRISSAGKSRKERTDEELAAASQKGDSRAEALLIERYRGLARQRSMTYYILGGDREDVVQEGMIGLFKAVRSYEPDKGASFATYAGVCIERQILDAIKMASRRRHEPLNTSLSLSEESTERMMRAKADLLGEEKEGELAKDLFSRIKGEWRSSFSNLEWTVLEKKMEGKSISAIAGELKREPKAVSNALERTKRKIRNLAEEHGMFR